VEKACEGRNVGTSVATTGSSGSCRSDKKNRRSASDQGDAAGESPSMRGEPPPKCTEYSQLLHLSDSTPACEETMSAPTPRPLEAPARADRTKIGGERATKVTAAGRAQECGESHQSAPSTANSFALVRIRPPHVREEKCRRRRCDY